MAKYPIYNLEIDPEDETGMSTISLVADPAVEYNFLLFDKDNRMPMYFTNKEERIVTGVSLLADTPIYRDQPPYGQHYVVFSKKLIKDMLLKFMKLQNNSSVSVNHTGTNVKGVTLIECYIINKDRGIVPIEFKDVPDGSLITSYKIEDNDIWTKVKAGEYKGFSIEGCFTYEDTQREIETIEEFLKELEKSY